VGNYFGIFRHDFEMTAIQGPAAATGSTLFSRGRHHDVKNNLKIGVIFVGNI
jgi:hypothetical protein